jgi:type IV pilus assembly protein PilQ
MGNKRILVVGSLVALALSFNAQAGEVSKIELRPEGESVLLELHHSGQGIFRTFQIEGQQRLILEAEGLNIPANLTRSLAGNSKGPVVSLTPYNSSNSGRPMAKLVLQLRNSVELKSSDHPGDFVLEIHAKKDSLPYIGRNPTKALKGSWLEADSLTNTDSAEKKSEEVARKLIEVLDAPVDEKHYFGSPVTFEASQADVHDIFRLVGEASGLNIVTDVDVNAKANFSIKDTPWDQLLDLVVQQSQLRAMVVGNIVRVMTQKTYNDIADSRKKEIQAHAQVQPVVMGVIPLGFADAAAMKTMLQGLLAEGGGGGPGAGAGAATGGGAQGPVTGAGAGTGTAAGAGPTSGTQGPAGGVSPAGVSVPDQDFKKGSIQVDARSNSLVVTDTKDAIERLRRLVKELDVPMPQVLIDAKVVIADETYAQEMGMNWGVSSVSGSGTTGFGFTFNQTSATSAVAGAGGATGGTTTGGGTGGSTFNTGTAGATTFTISGLQNGLGLGGATTLGASGRAALNASLQMAELNNLSKTVASPRIVVNNKQKANILDGQNITTVLAGGNGSQGTTSSVSANLSLDVLPQVTSHGSVDLNLSIQKDLPVPASSSNGGITTLQKHLTTDVLVDSGATLVLGGVYQLTATKASNGIPLLKDLPFIGTLFRLDSESSDKTELMVFITPQILDPEASTQSL